MSFPSQFRSGNVGDSSSRRETRFPEGFRNLIINEEEMNYLEKRLKEIEKPCEIPGINPRYSGLPDFNIIPATMDFPDDSLAEKSALILRRVTDDEARLLGKELFSHLTFGVSQKHVASIFLLAFQLRKPGIRSSDHIFPREDELGIISDKSLDEMKDDIHQEIGNMMEPTEMGSAGDLARGYAFVAASMLKLFIMPPETYVKSWNLLSRSYQGFYSTPLPFSRIVPSPRVIQQIYRHFSNIELFKNTLYRILYNGSKDGIVSSVQEYCYDEDLSLRGMHVLPITYKICVLMNIPPEKFLRVIFAGAIRQQIASLVEAYKLMANEDSKHVRRLWKYGRVFDENFLAPLRTKYCTWMCYKLACVLIQVGGKEHSGILNIRQFEDISEVFKMKLQEGSKGVVSAIEKAVNGNIGDSSTRPETPPFKRALNKPYFG